MSVCEPDYVKKLMFYRWVVLIGGGLAARLLDNLLVWAVAIAAFVLVTEYASRRYYKDDRESWEVSFHDETDGYSNRDGCDGDGD